MSSFIKSIDSSTTTSNSSILLGAIINESLDRANAIATAISSLQSTIASQIVSLQTAVSTEVVLRNQAIATSVSSVATLVNSSISVAFGSNSFGGTGLGTNASASSGGTAIGINCLKSNNGMNNVGIGASCCPNIVNGNYNSACGTSCLPSSISGSYNIGIGANAGQNLISGSNNTFLGSYSSTSLPTCIYSTAVGYGSQITDSNQIVLGTTGQSVVVPGTLSLITNYILSYTTLPTFSVNQIGYQSTISSTSTYVCLATGYLLTQTIPLLAGMYHVQFRFDFFSNNNTTSSGSFFYGLNQTNVIGATCFNKVNFSNITSNTPQSCFNSCIIKSTGACTYNLFIQMGSETLNPTSFSVNAIIITVTRLG